MYTKNIGFQSVKVSLLSSITKNIHVSADELIVEHKVQSRIQQLMFRL